MRRRVLLIASTLLLIACCGCVGYLGEGNYDTEYYVTRNCCRLPMTYPKTLLELNRN